MTKKYHVAASLSDNDIEHIDIEFDVQDDDEWWCKRIVAVNESVQTISGKSYSYILVCSKLDIYFKTRKKNSCWSFIEQ